MDSGSWWAMAAGSGARARRSREPRRAHRWQDSRRMVSRRNRKGTRPPDQRYIVQSNSCFATRCFAEPNSKVPIPSNMGRFPRWPRSRVCIVCLGAGDTWPSRGPLAMPSKCPCFPTTFVTMTSLAAQRELLTLGGRVHSPENRYVGLPILRNDRESTRRPPRKAIVQTTSNESPYP